MTHLFSDFRLLALDMDSTLITIECIDEIADFVGKKNAVSAITASAMRGEIDWSTSLRERVALLAGLDAAVLRQVYDQRLKLTDGAEALINAARQVGIYTLLVSGGFTFFTERLKSRLLLDEAHANQLDICNEILTGHVIGALCDANAKAQHVRAAATRLGIRREQIMVVGDGANDLPMMAEAGVSIAYCAKPIVQQKATHAINCGGLATILSLYPIYPAS